ncbi:MAG: hypothetical protein JXA74_05645, partial [Anaerolineae bacterium]|nr:hypothetical protein [Anaerolineae bacterium]
MAQEALPSCGGRRALRDLRFREVLRGGLRRPSLDPASPSEPPPRSDALELLLRPLRLVRRPDCLPLVWADSCRLSSTSADEELSGLGRCDERRSRP